MGTFDENKLKILFYFFPVIETNFLEGAGGFLVLPAEKKIFQGM